MLEDKIMQEITQTGSPQVPMKSVALAKPQKTGNDLPPVVQAAKKAPVNSIDSARFTLQLR
jgi:hypothetical protein